MTLVGSAENFILLIEISDNQHKIIFKPLIIIFLTGKNNIVQRSV